MRTGTSAFFMLISCALCPANYSHAKSRKAGFGCIGNGDYRRRSRNHSARPRFWRTIGKQYYRVVAPTPCIKEKVAQNALLGSLILAGAQRVMR